MSVVTSKDLVEEVRRVADAEPEYIYLKNSGRFPRKCSYFGKTLGVEEGNPCIIGKALSNLGVDMTAVKKLERRGEDPAISVLLKEGHINVEVVDDADIAWLFAVQNKQDLGMNWAESVKGMEGLVSG